MNYLSAMHLASRLVFGLLLAVAALILAAGLVLLVRSPGKPKPFLDGSGAPVPGSISEKGKTLVRGAELGYFIKGRDEKNPVLLYLHGGMPDYFLTERYPTALDEIFTVAWLDLRGAGRSFDPRRDTGTAALEDWVADAAAFSDQLRARFGQDRIYLMGRSGGTYLAVKLIEAYPEAFAAYIAVGQIADQRRSEKLAYDYILAAYADRPDRRKVYEELAAEPVGEDGPLPASYLRYRDYAMHDLGVGTMRGMKSVVTGLFVPSLLFSEFTLSDKIALWRAKAASGVSALWDNIMEDDLAEANLSFRVPVYFLHGEHDYTCSYELARDYFERIEAPDKGFFSFPDSAHSPIFEEPEECVRLIRERILPRS